MPVVRHPTVRVVETLCAAIDIALAKAGRPKLDVLMTNALTFAGEIKHGCFRFMAPSVTRGVEIKVQALHDISETTVTVLKLDNYPPENPQVLELRLPDAADEQGQYTFSTKPQPGQSTEAGRETFVFPYPGERAYHTVDEFTKMADDIVDFLIATSK